MFKELVNKVNNRVYVLNLNDKILNLEAKRVKGIKELVNSVSKTNLLKNDMAFFIYNEYNFSSYGFTNKVDLVFVDYDHKVIHIEENFDMNKITKKILGTKFIYVLGQGQVEVKRIIINDILTHVYKRK